MNASLQDTDKHIDEIMSVLLRTGVILAGLIVLVGGVLFLARHFVFATNYHVFQAEPEELRTIPGIVHEALAWRGQGLIQLGLLILIATPIARVAFSMCAFFYERDWKYVTFTLIVLGTLLYSLLSGYAQ
jgi:uncharacterized membrane protein